MTSTCGEGGGTSVITAGPLGAACAGAAALGVELEVDGGIACPGPGAGWDG